MARAARRSERHTLVRKDNGLADKGGHPERAAGCNSPNIKVGRLNSRV